MEDHGTIRPESLLEHGPRLRALARQLVGEARADDLVQETWVRAVERGPTGATPWRWLGRVVRNLASDERRLDAARSERERAVARNESEGDEGERFALHKELVAAIERLDAPYRQAILLRYFDALPPRRIAARLGVPVQRSCASAPGSQADPHRRGNSNLAASRRAPRRARLREEASGRSAVRPFSSPGISPCPSSPCTGRSASSWRCKTRVRRPHRRRRSSCSITRTFRAR
ncbi:MAG: sigma-70 family RNA polymerase sigma factor [Planctomycetes bacterium]|nr:sigma-70 family RNA polymerase sigma factor [Planctomycetota bacterium]